MPLARPDWRDDQGFGEGRLTGWCGGFDRLRGSPKFRLRGFPTPSVLACICCVYQYLCSNVCAAACGRAACVLLPRQHLSAGPPAGQLSSSRGCCTHGDSLGWVVCCASVFVGVHIRCHGAGDTRLLHSTQGLLRPPAHVEECCWGAGHLQRFECLSWRLCRSTAVGWSAELYFEAHCRHPYPVWL